MTFLWDFLPTSPNLPMESGWQLWFDEFMNIWKVLSNGSPIEFDIFALFSRLAWDNIGHIDWLPHIEFLFSKFFFYLNLSRCFGEKPTKSHSRISLVSIARWIVSNLGGSDGQEVLKYTSKMFQAMESFFHPANSENIAWETFGFIDYLAAFLELRVHNERYNSKKRCTIPSSKLLTNEDIRQFIESVKPLAFHMLYSSYKGSGLFRRLSTIRPDLIIPPLIKSLLQDDSWSQIVPKTMNDTNACQGKLMNQNGIKLTLDVPNDQPRTRCHQAWEDFSVPSNIDDSNFEFSNLNVSEIIIGHEILDHEPKNGIKSAKQSSDGMSTSSRSHDLPNPLPEHLFHNSTTGIKNEETFSTMMVKFDANLAGLQSCLRPLVEKYPCEVIKILDRIVVLIDIIDIDRSKIILNFISSVLNMIWLFDDK